MQTWAKENQDLWGVNKHKVPYVICLKEKHAIKTITYKHAQDSIHVYKFGSHIHALRHVTPNQKNIKAQRS